MTIDQTKLGRTVGIDLGTTYSVVAFVNDHGLPTTVVNGMGDLLTPSAIIIDESGIVVGKEAVKSSVISPDLYAECFKRQMGTKANVTINQVEVPPVVLSALLLERLRLDAEQRIGPVSRAVITVPAYFDEGRRIATQEAARLAGLDTLDIINEPTAAAVAYVHQSGLLTDKQSKTIHRFLVFDLGGGTFDATILEVCNGVFQTVATDGDVRLGGKDFDERLLEHVAKAFVQRHGADPRTDPEDAAQLWISVQELKHTLSACAKGTIVISHAGLRLKTEVTRAQFEELCAPLVERAITTTSLLLEESKLAWDQIDRILLVGGSARIPIIAERLKQLTGHDPDRSLSLDEAVACGAALYGKMLEEQGQDTTFGRCKLVNVNAHSLGVACVHSTSKRLQNQILIPKNTSLPSRRSRRFSIARDDQRSVKVAVLEGESPRPEECIHIGDCIVDNLPPGLKKGSAINVEYSYSADGCISVRASIPATRQEASVEISRKQQQPQDSLEIWKARLTGLPEELRGEPAEQVEQLLVHLGGVALTHTPPQELSSQFDASKQAIKLFTQANSRLSSSRATSRNAGRSEAIRFQVQIAKAEEELKQRLSDRNYALSSLGKACIKSNWQIPGTSKLIALILKLQQNT